jgi:Xaa-Pro aminopeptidase
MRKPTHDMNIFKQRRAKLATQAAGSAVIVPSHPELIRNHDVHYPHRQDSNLFYLTGFEEAEAILVFRPGLKPETVLFVRPKDELRETWDGFRYGASGTQTNFQVDQCYHIAEFDEKIVDLLKPVDRVYYRWNISREWDEKLLSVLDRVRLSAGRSGAGHLPVYDSWGLIGEQRLRKEDSEIANMREAARISAEAHCEAMRFVKPGVTETQVQGVLTGTAMLHGAQREGYYPIVASGASATTLHYNFNDQVCRDGDLLLIDAGYEKNYYTADITRTLPVNGKFSPAQRRVYEGVLNVQRTIINMIKPGVQFTKLQDTTIDLITELMIDLKLLSGSKQKLIESLEFKKYYMHGVSHWIGMDVHDVGQYKRRGESVLLEERMAFTVEPGIYIPQNDTSAPAEYRGIGIRIEEDVVVTKNAVDVLTTGVPNDVDGIERVMAEPSVFEKFAK